LIWLAAFWVRSRVEGLGALLLLLVLLVLLEPSFWAASHCAVENSRT
jgi:hypothetical protein